MKFDFNDISIVPAVQSTVISRTEVKPYYNQEFNRNWIKKSPIIVSPMDTVIDEMNFKSFIAKNMMVCMPRGTHPDLDFSSTEREYIFFSYGLDEFQNLINKGFNFPANVLIDIANGHISILPELIKLFKSRYKSHLIMVGNIANPETFRVLSEAGADYIRCGIGAGQACLTSKMTAIHYPMASLISETYLVKQDMIAKGDKPAKIVADGGFKEYADIIKGLAIGGDFIMVGSTLNKCIESCGETTFFGVKISNNLSKKMFDMGLPITKKFRGMSTKEVQKKWNKVNLRASEGVTRFRRVEFTLDGWYSNFEDYLKSCMSYTGFRKLEDFVGKPEFVQMTNSTYKRYDK